MQIKIYYEFNEEIKTYWKDLELISDITPFQTYIWIESWQKIIGSPVYKTKPVIICLFNEDTLEAIIPLCIKKEGFISILEWLGGPNTDYMLPIIKKDSYIFTIDFFNLWSDIKSNIPHHDILHLTKQPAKIGINKNPFVHSLNSSFIMNSYQSFIKNDWEDYKEAHISKKVLADSRRQRKRLAEIGNLNFKIFSDEEGMSQVTKTMLRQKKRRYQEKEGWDMFQISEFKDFYLGLPKQLSMKASVHCSALLLDTKIIACHWGILEEEKLFYLMPTHEGGEYSKYSAGKLLLEELHKWCSLTGVNYLDFTGGDEHYKKIWTNQSEKLFEALESNSLKGNFYLYFNYLKSVLKRAPIIGKYLRNFYHLIKRK